MKKLLEKVQNTEGFVSVEVIVIAGVVIVLAVVIMYFLATKGRGIATTTGANLDDAQQKISSSGEIGSPLN